jgi:hypothetical protein
MIRDDWCPVGDDESKDASVPEALPLRAELGRLQGPTPRQIRQEQTRTCIVTPMLRWDLRSYIWCFTSMLDRSTSWRINFHISNFPKNGASEYLPRIAAVVVQDAVEQRVGRIEKVGLTGSGDILVTLRPKT